MNQPFIEAMTAVDKGAWKKARNIISKYPYVLNLANENGKTVLWKALSDCDIDFIDFLHSKHCNFNFGDPTSSPLFFCLFLNQLEKAERLQKYGAKMSAYEEAADAMQRVHDLDRLEWLLKHQPSLPYDKNHEGKNLLHYAVSYVKDIRFTELLCRYIDIKTPWLPPNLSVLGCLGAIRYPGGPAASPSSPDKLQKFDFLLQQGAEMFPEEQLSLHIYNAELDKIDKMIRQSPELLFSYCGSSAPLHCVVGAGRSFSDCSLIKLMLEKLLSYGADINILSDYSFQTPLFKASYSNEIAEFLIARGARVNVRDKDNNTPLHLAMTSVWDWPQALLDAGADLNAINNQGETPYDCAAKYNLWGAPVWRRKIKQLGGKSGKDIRRE